jgi:hypothetical protein
MPGPIGALLIGVGLVIEGGYAARESMSKRKKDKQAVPVVTESVLLPSRTRESSTFSISVSSSDGDYSDDKQISSKLSQLDYQAAVDDDLLPPAYEDAIASSSSTDSFEDCPDIDTPSPIHPALRTSSSSSSQQIYPSGPLDLPIIIPQRRPNNKSRGWTLAYSPELAKADIS